MKRLGRCSGYILAIVVTCMPLYAHATAGLVDGIWFSENPAVDSTSIVVYSVLHNQTKDPLEGIATLIVDGSARAAEEVKLGAGDIRKVSIAHEFTAGSHAVALAFTARNSSQATNTALGTKTLVVYRDSDSDGVADKDDPDDDNDGLLDADDPEPLVARATEEKGVLGNVLSTLGQKTHSSTDNQENNESATTTDSTIGALIAALEAFRQESAVSVQAYEDEKRTELAAIESEENRGGNVEGFSTTQEESNKREQQIAAASAATLGWMLDKKFVFYAEIVVLLLGVTHILWVWFKSLLRARDVEEGEEY